MGPAMLALKAPERAFVVYLTTSGDDDFARAAAAAGYPLNPKPDWTPDDVWVRQRQIGYALSRQPKILEAVKEEAKKRLSSAVGIATHGLIEIIKDPTIGANHRLKAIDMLLNRGGLPQETAVQRHAHIHAQVAIDRNDVDAARRRINSLASTLGIDPNKLADVIEGREPKTIEGEAEEPTW